MARRATSSARVTELKIWRFLQESHLVTFPISGEIPPKTRSQVYLRLDLPIY